jgi:hypothetical protein
MFNTIFAKYHLGKQYRYFGILLVIISLCTWLIDIHEFVEICQYCRIQRTIIGVIGLLFIIDSTALYLSIGIYIFFVGFAVSLAQVIKHLLEHTYLNVFTIMAIGSGYLLLISFFFGLYRVLQKNGRNAGK